ncbi:MAG: hypothetical protein LBJ47_02485 [Tannerella sp.]|jgi:hypothetical protein|nr:hypothetical protein [Tannerella sp.]
MENQQSKIEFYRQRTFSEKLNTTFSFIRENWKPLLKYTFYLIMPVCLVQTYAMNSAIGGYFGLLSSSMGGSGAFGSNAFGFLADYGVLLFCSLIGSAIISGMVYAMMQTYATRENGLQQVTLGDFRENLTVNAWKCLRISLFFILAYALIAVMAGILAALVSVVSLFFTIPLLILFALCLIPLMMLVPVYVFERDIRFSAAVRKAWKLGMETLGGLLGIVIVLSLISSVVQTVTMLPWYIVTVFGYVFSLTTESAMDQSAGYRFLLYILGLIQSYGAYAASTIGAIGLAFHYFHAREKVEGVTVESDISNFNRL